MGRDDTGILVRTRNHCTPEQAARAIALISRLSGHDPQIVYQQEMAAAARRSLGSGLGLLRLAAECAMTLSSRHEVDSLVIEARSERNHPANPADSSS